MLLMVFNAMPRSVCLNRLVMDRTSRPTYVNLAHFLVLHGYGDGCLGSCWYQGCDIGWLIGCG
jgi:hypothetical protein